MPSNMESFCLDFESGDLSFWTVEGEAFADQPIRGDRMPAHRARPGLIPLGGDYWDGPYPLGHQGNYWVGTADHLTGTLTSDEFTIDERYPWFSFLLGGGCDSENLRVELLVKATSSRKAQSTTRTEIGEDRWESYPLVSLANRGNYYRVFEVTGNDSEIMRRVVFNVVSAHIDGEPACIRIVDSSTTNHINVDDFRFSADCPQVTPLAEGGGDPSAPVWGFADLHTHPMAALGFGGTLFWGKSDGAMEDALSCCTPAHGRGGSGLMTKDGVNNLLMAFFEMTGHKGGLPGWLQVGHRVGGYPEFDGWPRFTTIIHQQMYVDWVKRAYEGGLRLMVAHVVNNELLAHEFSNASSQADYDDRTAVETQIRAMKEFASRHSDWMEIAYSPADARRIIRQNKLAVVLGVEVDSLGNWKHEEDCTESNIQSYLSHLYNDLGVRHLFPIHLANNAFGGAAISNDMFNVLNRFLRGDYFQVEDGSDRGVQFKLGEDPGPAVNWYQSPVGLAPLHIGAYYAPPDYQKIPGGHINVEGLTPPGQFLIREMMRIGLLIDVDHMSYKATNATLELAEQRNYPVISGHTQFQELAWQRDESANIHKYPNEYFKTSDQIERIRRLGGIIAPILNQGDNRNIGSVMPRLTGKVSEECAGSSTSWANAYLYAVEKMAGRGIGIGTDMNGFNKSLCPRFGLNASYYLHYHIPGMGSDKQRQGFRGEQINAQKNGVHYSTPIKDTQRSRFEGVLEGEVYDSLERDIWQAMAHYYAGLNPWASDDSLARSNGRVENLARGFWAGSEEQLARPTAIGIGNEPSQQRAAFLVKTGRQADRESKSVQTLYKKILPIWQKWLAMQGSNVPLSRSYAGQRDFDINIDGVAHYGMLPDLFQDLKNIGLTDEDLLPLFRSAEDYIQTWEKCERSKG